MMRIWTCCGVSIENFSWFGKREWKESEVVLGPNVFCLVARGLYTDYNTDPTGVETIDLVQLLSTNNEGY